MSSTSIASVSPVEASVAAALADNLARALSLGGRQGRRLRSARTSVAFVVDGDRMATLLLDRDPPQVVSADEPAAVAIFFSGAQAAAYLRGELIVPTEMLAGNVGWSGPVRSYLCVDPVLRALLRAGT